MTSLPPLQDASVSEGDLVRLSGVPRRAELDGTGARVLAIVTPDELELELEGDARERLQVHASCVAKLAPFPETGISLACLREFCAAYEGKLRRKTTDEVCRYFIKPITAPSQSSLAEALQRLEESGMHNGLTGKANVFISHTLKYEFLDLVDALEAYILSLPAPENVYVWLDVFVVNQHQSAVRPKIWWTETYQRGIGNIGKACLVLSPWNAPIPLTRSWCLWELASVAQTGARLDFALGTADAASLEKGLPKKFKALVSDLALVDIRRALAHHHPDKKIIREVAESTIGLNEFNAQVIGLVREWLVHVGREMLAKLPYEERAKSPIFAPLSEILNLQGHYLEAEAMHRHYLKMLTQWGTSNANVKTLKTLNNLALALKGQGKLEEAEEMQRETLYTSRACLRPHEQVLQESTTNLGIIIQARGRLGEAEALHRKALELSYSRNADLSEAKHYYSTLALVENLASVLRMLGKTDAAEKVHQDFLKIRRHRDAQLLVAPGPGAVTEHSTSVGPSGLLGKGF